MNQNESPFYVVADHGRSITCKICGRTSWHPADVQHKFCAHCKVFHEDQPLAGGPPGEGESGKAGSDTHGQPQPAGNLCSGAL